MVWGVTFSKHPGCAEVSGGYFLPTAPPGKSSGSRNVALQPAGMCWVRSEELILHRNVFEHSVLSRDEREEIWGCQAWDGSGYAQSRMSHIFTCRQTENRGPQDWSATVGTFGVMDLGLNASAEPKS